MSEGDPELGVGRGVGLGMFIKLYDVVDSELMLNCL